VHDIIGDIKCIIAVHGNFNACYIEPGKHAPQIFNYFFCCEDKLLFKTRLRVIRVGQQITNEEKF